MEHRGKTPKLAEYRRIAAGNEAWALLRASNSPLVLAFLEAAFQSEAEIDMAEARAVLDSLLVAWRELEAAPSTETESSAYLRQWIGQGYLREADYRLSMTDAAQIAKRFAEGLDRRDMGATASHLRVVQEAVQNLILRLSGDTEVRRTILLERKHQIERELDELGRGIVDRPDAKEERELVNEALFLARQLTGDFRYVEDEIRGIDADLRRKMIESADAPGAVLRDLLDRSDLLAASTAGAAFQGFFQLLCDDNRSTEFRQQLRQLASGELAPEMNSEERLFFGNLMRLLTHESQQVVRRRQRTEESLRAFLESDAHRENRAIEGTLAELFRIGITLNKDSEFNPNLDLPLVLNSGPVHMQMLEHLLVMQPSSELSGDLVVHDATTELPDDLFDRFDTVPVKEIADAMLQCLREHGALTVGGVTAVIPIEYGLEELVVRVRVAQAVHAIPLGAEEVVEFTDGDRRLRARIPSLVMSPDAFPHQIDELAL